MCFVSPGWPQLPLLCKKRISAITLYYAWQVLHIYGSFFFMLKVVSAYKVGGVSKERRGRGEKAVGGKKNKETRGRCAGIVVVWPEASWAEQRWSLSLTAWIQHSLHHTNSTKSRACASRLAHTQCLGDAQSALREQRRTQGITPSKTSNWPTWFPQCSHYVCVLCAADSSSSWRQNNLYTNTLFIFTTFSIRMKRLFAVRAETSYIRNSCGTTVIYYNKATSPSQKCPSKQFNSQWHSSATHCDFYRAENDSYCALPRFPPTAISAWTRAYATLAACVHLFSYTGGAEFFSTTYTFSICRSGPRALLSCFLCSEV